MKNRETKLTKHKKLPSFDSGIDNCSPLEILKLQRNLIRIAQGEGIEFVQGKGKYKPEIQKLYEELEECGTRLMGYKDCFEIMRKDRNSYSKTDLEATFMRMKEDPMLNGQLKPAYNVQIAVENYFIMHGYVSNDRTDYQYADSGVGKAQESIRRKSCLKVTADSGYCSEEKNLLYLKWNHQLYQTSGPRKAKEPCLSGRHREYSNMKYEVFEDEHYYVCRRKELRHIGQKERTGWIYTDDRSIRMCADCSGCEHKSKYLYRYKKNQTERIDEDQ